MIPDEEPPLTKEEIELKLDKIDEIEAIVKRHENEIIQINKRITRLQDHKRKT